MAAAITIAPSSPIHSRHDSSTPSDDSSLYELSFAYTQDDDGHVVRVSRRREAPEPAVPHVASPTYSNAPPSVSTLANMMDQNFNIDGGLRVPRRSSLSRSESAPYPIDGGSFEGGREFKRVASTPLHGSTSTRPKSVHALGINDYNAHNKENEQVGNYQAPLQTPIDKFHISRKQAPLPLRVSRSNPPVTPSNGLLSTQTPVSQPPYIRDLRMSSTPAVPLSRWASAPAANLHDVDEAPAEIPISYAALEGTQVALPESPPLSHRTASRISNGSVSLSNGVSSSGRPSDSSGADMSSTPEEFDSYYSRPSISSEADVAPRIPPRAPSRGRNNASLPPLQASQSTSLSRATANRARRIPVLEKKRQDIERDFIDEPEPSPPSSYADNGRLTDDESPPAPPAVHTRPEHVAHRRRDSETIIPASHPQHPNNIQDNRLSQPRPPTENGNVATPRAPVLAPSQTLGVDVPPMPGLSPTSEGMLSRHRRSPTAPEAPTSSAGLGGNKDRASSRTWGSNAAHAANGNVIANANGDDEDDRQPDDRQPLSASDDRKERDRSEKNGGILGPGTRQFLVNRKSYIRLDLLGRGGSSRVYRVLTPTNEIYALKRISLDKANEEEIAGYRNEISLLKRLEGNERIIRLIDAEVRGGPRGSLMLVMECGEIDLAHLLQRKQTLAVDMVWIRYYWKQMLEAVQVIHDEKIVHSDLKPANFVLVKGELKLIDFGIANAISNDTTNIQRDHQIGTVNYMSPEAIECPEGMRRLKVGRSSDVWSLGCILYQMIYGQAPFAALSTLGKMKAIPDPDHSIDYPTESAPFLPASPTDSPGNRPREWKKKVNVPRIVIGTLKSCLIRNPKERAMIPELLESGWLDEEKQKVLQDNQAAIDAHLMSQALQHALKHGKNDPEWLKSAGERLVTELQKIASLKK